MSGGTSGVLVSRKLLRKTRALILAMRRKKAEV